MGKSKTFINLVCSLLVLVTNLFISFWLSPFVIKNIGIEANGFVTLANNFVMYAALITGALNSMASRFITFEHVRGNFDKANLYYNSVFWGNLIVAILLLLPAALLILKLEMVVHLPDEIKWDVKLLFTFVFIIFFINTGAPNWECGTYVTNRLDRDYIPNMITSILRCLLIFLMMVVLMPRVWYLGFASCLVAVILLLVRRHNTRTLTPYLRIKFNRKDRICSWSAIKELVSSGIWNSISSVGYMLLVAVDLLICNMYLGAVAMGIVALSKTIPTMMEKLSSSVRDAFGAELTINYASGDKNVVFSSINRAMKITSFILIVPVAFIVVFGDWFFSLWVPSQDAKLLQSLSAIAIIGYMFTSGTQILYNVFSTVNKVKQNSIAMLISGVVSVSVLLILLKYTKLGLFAVVSVTVVVNLIRNMCYTLPATAKFLDLNWKCFYPQVGRTMMTSLILIFLGVIIKPYLHAATWFEFIVSGLIFTIIAFLISSLILLNRSERHYLLNKILVKLKIKKI